MTLVRQFRVCLFRGAYGVLAGLTFVSVTLLTVVLLTVLPGEYRRRRLVKASAGLIFRLTGSMPRVAGMEQLPAGACILAANHASYIDGIILTAVLPPRFTFVIKREMTRVPLAHFLLRRIGSEFVDRYNSRRGAQDIRRILGHAERQESLVFFPEGTFRDEPGLRRFHNGAFAAAVRGRTDLVPVVIRGSRRMLPASRWLPRPAPLEVIIKQPLAPPENNGQIAGLMATCRQSILEDLDEPDLARQ